MVLPARNLTEEELERMYYQKPKTNFDICQTEKEAKLQQFQKELYDFVKSHNKNVRTLIHTELNKTKRKNGR